MEDIGLHPDSGKREPPDLAPHRLFFRVTFTGVVAAWAPLSVAMPDLKARLESLIEDRGLGDGLVTPEDYEAELVEYELEVEVE